MLSTFRTDGHNPRVFLVREGDDEYQLRVYAWTLTPGGRPQLENEYRIQLTSVEPPLDINGNALTCLVGYEPNRGMFVGFDLQLHRSFTPGSPSIQVDVRTLNDGLQHGLAFHVKSNEEIALGIRPDLFLTYARNAKVLHTEGSRAEVQPHLAKAFTLEKASPGELASLASERKQMVNEARRWSRSARFKTQVLLAYDRRCAVTRMQLRIVEAAHLVPVSVSGSVDHVSNGIALSPTYHRAFDRGLIFLDEDLEMRLNEDVAGELHEDDETAGLDDFASLLGPIHLPPDPAQRPGRMFVKRAKELRGIS